MSLPYLLGFGDLEIEERRPRSANEPRVKRLYFAKNRRHIADDWGRGRRRTSDDWAVVPYDARQRSSNQIAEWDRRKAAAQLHFDRQEFHHQRALYGERLRFEEEQHRRRMLEAEQLNHAILQGQRPPPHYMQHMRGPMGQPQGPPIPPHHGDQELDGRGRGHGGHHNHHGYGGHGGHGGHGGQGGHSGLDPRIQAIGDQGADDDGPGGDHEDSSDSDSEAESRHGGRGDNRHRRDSSGGRNRRRGRHQDHERDIVIEIIEPGSEDEHGRRHSPRRIDGGHDQRLPREYRRRSRSRAYRSHSRRSRNQTRTPSRRRQSRRRRPQYLTDSESDSEYEDHVRFARPLSRARGSLIRERSENRQYDYYSSDDSFDDNHSRPRPLRVRSHSRRPRWNYVVRR